MKTLVQTDDVKAAYRRYAAIYDNLFGAVFEPGRRSAIARINTRENQRILEVGVGTGLSLSHYRADARVTGIDISRHMLERARRRIERFSLAQVDGLLEMDAEAMGFQDATFDVVVGMYVASVVQDPARLLAEMRRVCVPGGDVVIVNHFASKQPLLRGVEKAFSPLAAQIGFQPDFDLDTLLDLAGIEVLEIAPVNVLGYWKLIRMRNVPAMSASQNNVSQMGYSVDYDLRGRSSVAE